MSLTATRILIPTRWNDNDQYGHLNNTVYYEAMDTAINTWMLRHGVLDPLGGSAIAVCAASSCTFHASASFPDTLAVEIGVARLGRTSLTWALTILSESEQVLATGSFVHVFVDAVARTPVAIPEAVRTAVQTHLPLVEVAEPDSRPAR